MGLSFNQVLSQLRALGNGAQVEMALVSNQDDLLVSYARGFLEYHVHHVVMEEGLSRTEETLAADSLQYLFNKIHPTAMPGPGFGGPLVLQPFSVEDAEPLKVSFHSLAGIASNPVTIELTRKGYEAFSVKLTPLGGVLHGVGQPVAPATHDSVAAAVYLVPFGQPFKLEGPPH